MEPGSDVATPAIGGAVFDVHQHYGPVPGWPASAGLGRAEARADCERRVEAMARHGIDQACLQPASGYERASGTVDLARLNDAVADLQSRDRRRFPAALGTIDLWLGAAAIERETQRLFDELGFDGVAWHHRLQGAYIDDPRMNPVLHTIAERGKVAAIHVFAESTFEAPWRLENLADAFPQITFLALDAFSSYDQACWMSRIARTHSNVVFDTAAMSTNANLLAQFVSANGPGRLLLGTNYYGAQQTEYYPYALHLLRASSEIDADAKRRVLGGNARDVFGIADPALT